MAGIGYLVGAAAMDGVRVLARCSTLLLLVLTGCAADHVTRRASLDVSEKFVARATDGRLEDLRDEVRSRESPPSNSPIDSCSSRSRDDECDDDDDGLMTQMFGSVALGIVSSPFAIPCAAIGDEYEHKGMFPSYPYELNDSAMFIDGEYEGIGRGWMANVQLVSVDSLGEDVKRYSGRLLLDTSSRFGLDVESNHWHETFSGGGHDGLRTGDANVVFRFAQSEHWQFRAGAGVNWLTDDVGSELGVNFTYGADWFPRKPWTVSSVIDVGKLGGAGLFHNRTTVGAMVGRAEIFCGYDVLQLGSICFHGPVTGIGLRF